MRVVIPYKKVGNRDIVYAVRSVLKHYKPVSEIVVVGDKPPLPARICDRVRWTRIEKGEDPDKEYSIFCKIKEVRGRVLFMNDDHFFLRNYYDIIPNYSKGRCGDVKGLGPYYMKMYRNCPGDWYDFDVHCPMEIDTTRLEWKGQMPLKSQYGNGMGLEPVVTHDFKVRTVVEFHKALAEKWPFVSTPNSLSRILAPELEKLFPAPKHWGDAQ